MTERYAEVTARIGAIEQLHTVVTAMRGIAAARAGQARAALGAVDAHAALIAGAIRRLLALGGPPPGRGAAAPAAIVVFGAEQGFAGAFTERVLDALGTPGPRDAVFLVGTRAAGIAAERGLAPVWTAAMPLHPAGVPRLADRLADALFERVAAGGVGALDLVWRDGTPGEPLPKVERRRVFPLDLAPETVAGPPPLLDLDPGELLADLAEDYVHAQICAAALNAFAAENDARLTAMAAARGQVERRLESLRAAQRQVRQEEITAEIIELAGAAGATQDHARNARPEDHARNARPEDRARNARPEDRA